MNWFALLTLTIITLTDNCLPAESVCLQMGVVSKTCATTGLWTTLVDAVVGPSEVWSHNIERAEVKLSVENNGKGPLSVLFMLYCLSFIFFTLIPFLMNSPYSTRLINQLVFHDCICHPCSVMHMGPFLQWVKTSPYTVLTEIQTQTV